MCPGVSGSLFFFIIPFSIQDNLKKLVCIALNEDDEEIPMLHASMLKKQITPSIIYNLKVVPDV